jgi:hypothetical protein
VVEPAAVTPFYLTAAPSTRAVDPGGAAQYTIDVGSSGGSTATVNLSVTSPSPSLILQLSPPAVVPPSQATLTITDGHEGPTQIPGLWYIVPIIAANGITQTTSVSLLVGGVRVYLPIMQRHY